MRAELILYFFSCLSVQEANTHAEARNELERKLKELERQSKFGKEELQEQVFIIIQTSSEFFVNFR